MSLMNRVSKQIRIASLVAAGLLSSSYCIPITACAEQFCLASSASASTRIAPANGVRDVALQTGNTLNGQVVDSEGMAQANYEVWITRDSGPSLRTRTDASGRFTAAELAPGDYRIETAAGGGKFRLWAPKSAPIDAASNVLLIVTLRVAG